MGTPHGATELAKQTSKKLNVWVKTAAVKNIWIKAWSDIDEKVLPKAGCSKNI